MDDRPNADRNTLKAALDRFIVPPRVMLDLRRVHAFQNALADFQDVPQIRPRSVKREEGRNL